MYLSHLAVDGLVLLRYILVFYVNIFTMALQGLRDDEILNFLGDGTVLDLKISDEESNDNFINVELLSFR